MRPALIRTVLFAAACVLAGCDQRPKLRVVPVAGAPSPPVDATFALLPSRDEVRATMHSMFETLDPEIELVGAMSGDVRWFPVAKAEYGHPGFWVFHPKSRLISSAATAQFPAAEQLWLDPVRWRYHEGKWELDGMFNDYVTKFRGIDDPTDAQVAALLQQPGLQYGLHDIGSVPRKIRLHHPARASRDAEGFAIMQYPVEFTAETDIIDFPNGQLHQSEVTVRAVVYCDVREGKWRTRDEVAVVARKRLSSRPADDDELFKHRWAIDSWWRDH